MGRENVENWSVRKCSTVCDRCEKEFADKESIFSRLSFEQGEYLREDFCQECWNKSTSGLSSWKTQYLLPPPPREEAVKKENAETLLRKLMTKENEEHLNAIFILAVMLERKKILVERDVKIIEDGRKLRVYEHRKTNESFTVIDPQLKLDEIEKVQDEVVILLGGKPRNPGPDDEVQGSADSNSVTPQGTPDP